MTACARVRLFTSRMQCRKRSILTCFLSFASSAKAWDRRSRRSAAGARRPRQRQASPALVKPISAISRAIASSSRPIEVASARSTGIVAAGRTDLACVAGETVGKVDPDPVAAEAAVGERGAARVGFGA